MRRAGSLLVVLAFVAAVLYPLTVLGRALYWGDLFLYFSPTEQIVRDSFLAGRLPLWNPYMLCGQPLVGNPQSWVFYPASALLAALPVWLYFTVSALLHLGLGGLGAYLFLRRLCADRLGALLGAATYAGCGYLVARLQFPPMVQASAYLPWMLLAVDRLVDRPRVGYAALLACVVALEVLAAHAQIAYMTFLCAGLYAVARLWHARRHRARVRAALAGMLAALSVGVCSAAVQLLPTLQLFPLSTREKLTFLQANRFVLLPEELLNLVWPHFYGDPARADYWALGNAWEPCIYVGLVPLALAVYAGVRGRRRPAARFFAAAAVLSLWMALGKYGGLYWLAFYAVPGVASFHDPARFAFLTAFSLACLAAIGMRALRDRGVASGWRLALLVLGMADLWWFSSRLNPAVEPAALAHRPAAMPTLPSAGEGRVCTLQEDRVWKRQVSYFDFGPETADYARSLTDTLIPNSGMRCGVEYAGGYEPVGVRAANDVKLLITAAAERQAPNLLGLLGLCNTRVVVLPAGTRWPHPGLAPLPARGLTAFAVLRPMPRAWAVRATIRVDGAQRALAVLGAPDFDLRALAVVSGSDGLGDNPSRSADLPTATTRRVGPAASELDVEAGGAPAFVVWSATWYPGWTAAVDDRPALLERTDRAFCGVVVPPGSHHVRFAYRPFVFRLGLYLSLAAGALIAFGLGYGLLERRAARARG